MRSALLATLSSAALLAAAARAEEIDYKKLYARVGPGVVLIYGEQGKTGSVGTGSIIRDDGLVVTNAHVILEHESKRPFERLAIFLKPDRITGRNEDDLKRYYAAQWLAFNPDLDLALLRIVDPPQGLTVIALSDDSHVGVGEATAAIGHPEHGAKWSLTTGRIGGEWSDFEGVKGKEVYQMETSVNRGNSGGPLLDGNGYLIGINTSIARRAADGLAITGVNFAVKSAVVRRWIGELKAQIAAAPEVQPEAAPPPSAVARAEPPPLETAPAAAAAPPASSAGSGSAAGSSASAFASASATDPAAGSPAAAKPAPRPPAPTQALPPPTPEQKQVAISAAVPPLPAPPARGFTTREKPGRVLSPTDLVKERAAKAFDELDAESQKRRR